MKMPLNLTWKHGLLALTLVSVIVAHLTTLTLYPQSSCDEATYASNADALLQQGQFGLTIYTQGDVFGRDQNMVHMGRLPALGQALVLKALGFNLAAARLYSLLELGMAAVVLFEIGRRLYGVAVGCASALLFGVAAQSFLAGHEARPDIGAALAVLLAFLVLCYFLDRPAVWLLAIGTGIIGVVPFEFHANGLWFLASFCGVVFVEYMLLQRDWIKFLGYASGVLIGLGLWLLAHLLPNPTLAWNQLTVGYRVLGNSPVAQGLLYNLGLTGDWLWQTVGPAYGPIGFLEIGLTAIGVGWAARHLNPANRRILIVVAVSAIGFSAGMSQKFTQYIVLWLPFIFLLSMAALVAWFSKRRHKLGKVTLTGETVFMLIVAALVTVNLAAGLWLGYRFRDSQTERMNSALLKITPSGSRVLASAVWWWALRDERIFISDEYVFLPFLYPGKPNDQTTQELVEQTIRKLHPDFIVMGRALGCNNEPDDIWQALKTHVSTECQWVADLQGPWVNDPSKKFSYLGQVNSVYECSGPKVGVAQNPKENSH